MYMAFRWETARKASQTDTLMLQPHALINICKLAVADVATKEGRNRLVTVVSAAFDGKLNVLINVRSYVHR